MGFQNDTFMAVKIEFAGNIWPEKRMQMTFNSIGAGYIMLYGGKMAEEWDEDIFYDREDCVYAYHIEKQ